MNQEKAQRSSYHFCEPALISLPTQLSAAAESVNRSRLAIGRVRPIGGHGCL